MTTNIEFWERVHLALDERRDPLEDEGVQDAIAGEPALLDELEVLRARLRALPPQRARSRRSLAAMAAAAVIAAGAIALYLLRAPSAAVGPIAELAAPTPTSFVRDEIVDFELTITTERPGVRDTVVIDPAGTRQTRRMFGPLEHYTLAAEVLTPGGR